MSAPKELCLRSAGKRKKRLDQAPQVWNKFATTYVLYMDDSLLGGPDKDDIDEVIKQLRSKAKFEIGNHGQRQPCGLPRHQHCPTFGI
jgi:hypothetical protein